MLAVEMQAASLFAFAHVRGAAVGALAMHLKIRDPLKKSVPALVMLAPSISICLGSMR